MRGIVLAGGSGTRLWPLTKSINKQLLPIYDKPMIYYPIATLMTAGIREILIITNPSSLDLFEEKLGDGSNFGVKFEFKVQNEPKGIVDALLAGEDFIGAESVALILGDNIFHGVGLGRKLEEYKNPLGADIFAYKVAHPENYGIIEFDESGRVIEIVEKPINSKSNWAIPGIYFFDNTVCTRAKLVKPSKRGELEITSLLNSYLQDNQLSVSILPRGTAWLDTGNFSDLHDAGTYFKLLEERQGTKVGCLEEIAWRLNYISTEQFVNITKLHEASPYGSYLCNLLDEEFSKDW